MVVYTIAMCNYNMSGTIEESLRSILDQVDNRFELLVVDGGSTDGSQETVRELQTEYDNLRLVSLEADSDRHLGDDRQRSVEEATGEYVLIDLDCDDIYGEGILDFVEVYHQLESQLDREFLLKGEAINMAPRSVLMEIPFRNVGMSEDKDLYRRLWAQDAIVELKHEPFWKTRGYGKDASGLLRRFFRVQVTEFRTGITYPSYVRWLLWGHRDVTDYNWKRPLFELLASPLAYLTAARMERFDLPEEFREMGALYETRERERRTLEQIESDFDIEVDRDRLTERGEEIFFGERVHETPDEY